MSDTRNTMPGRAILSLFLAFFAQCSFLAAAMPVVTLVQDSLVTDSGLTLPAKATYGSPINGLAFQQDIITSYNGYQYVTWYNSARHVCLARRVLPTGQWETIEFTDYTFPSDDAHNTISLGICTNDGTIHLAFDHHGDDLNYRVSRQGVATNPTAVNWNSDIFGPVTDKLQDQPVKILTYPAFVRTPDGNLQLFYRYGTSGDGIWKIYDYNGKEHTWGNDRVFINAAGSYSDSLGGSTTRCAYPNYYCYGPDGRLQVSWCWRESASGANHDICYAFSTDKGYNWYGASSISALPDNIICNTTDKIISVNTDEIVVKKLDRAYGMMNSQAHAIDPQGRPHIVMWHCTDESLAAANSKPGATRWGPATARAYHHYWQDADGSWQHQQIPGYAGSRPKLFIRANGDAILLFQSCRTVESLGQEIYFTDGDLKIMAATAASKWSDWQEIYQLKNGDSFFMNEMLADTHRFAESQGKTLSVFVQDKPTSDRQPTAIRILDLDIQ